MRKINLIILSILLSTFGLLSQTAVTQSDFIGTFTFSSFSAGGTADVVGDLSSFNDQTTQYFASAIQVGDVVWDNSGNRWRVAVVNSSNLTNANVDLVDVNSAGGTPFGVGLVSRETSLIGLTLPSPDNSTGISQQLKARIEGHNFIMIDSILQLYVDSLQNQINNVQAEADTVYDSGLGFYVHGLDGVTTTSGSQGNYDIDYFADSVRINSVQVEFDNASDYTVGGEAIIVIDANTSDFNTSFANAIVPSIKIYDSGGIQREPADVSVTVTNAVASGQVTCTIANINGIGLPARVRIQF